MTMLHQPALSILIPVHNSAATLGRTLDSLSCVAIGLRGSVQVIVVNNGSIDDSLVVAESGIRRSPDFQWTLVNKERPGVSAARNSGIDQAQGEWLLFLDSDDELTCDPLPLVASTVDASCICCAVKYRGPGTTTRHFSPPRITSRNRTNLFTASSPLPICSVLVRRCQISHRFDEDIRYTEDWLFWNQNEAIFDRVSRRPDVDLARVYLHESNASVNYSAWGRDRTIVASRIAAHYQDRLTRKQRNNLAIHAQIGDLQQREALRPSILHRLPCSGKLYLKMLVYWCAALMGTKATPYRAACASVSISSNQQRQLDGKSIDS